MSRYDGLIIPRSYSEYINKTDAATLLQALQLSGVMDAAPTAGSNHPAQSGGVKTALDALQSALQPVNVVESGNTKAVSSAAVYTAYKGWTEWFTLIPKFALTSGTNQKTLSYNRKISDYLFILFTLGNIDSNTRETMLIPATQLEANATAYGFCYVGGVLKEADITITSDTTISVTGDVGLYLGMYGVIKKLT